MIIHSVSIFLKEDFPFVTRYRCTTAYGVSGMLLYDFTRCFFLAIKPEQWPNLTFSNIKGTRKGSPIFSKPDASPSSQKLNRSGMQIPHQCPLKIHGTEINGDCEIREETAVWPFVYAQVPTRCGNILSDMSAVRVQGPQSRSC